MSTSNVLKAVDRGMSCRQTACSILASVWQAPSGGQSSFEHKACAADRLPSRFAPLRPAICQKCPPRWCPFASRKAGITPNSKMAAG